VLNGIVLIEHFKEMRHEGHLLSADMIIRGAKSRLRPVLLTASAAALGFLPMAISHGAGAEVQRPLATVVIGGLITSTLLTLIVVPVFYMIMNKTSKLPSKAIMIVGLLVASASANAQLTIDEAIRASHDHPALRGAYLEVEQKQAMSKTYSPFQLPEVYHSYDQNNIAENGFPIAVWGVSQAIPLPGSNSGIKKQAEVDVEVASVMAELQGRRVESIVIQAYLEVVYADNQLAVLNRYKPTYDELVSTAELSVSLGQSPGIDVIRATNRKQQFLAEYEQAKSRQQVALYQLNQLIGQEVTAVEDSLVMLIPYDADLQTLEQKMLAYEKEKSVYAEKAANQQLLPTLQAEVFQGSNDQVNARAYNGFRIGLQLPLWPGTVKNKQKAAQLQQEIADARLAENAINNAVFRTELERQIAQTFSQIEQLRVTSLPLARTIKTQLKVAKEAGEIDFFYYLNALEEAKVIELDYIAKCKEYNQNVIYYNQVY
jgi:cobalt-zinc-cadmium resistance protein CzcA